QQRLPRSELPVALSPDGKVLACSFDGGETLLYDVATGKLLATLLPQSAMFNNLAFSPDGRHLALRDMIGFVHVWDWAQAKKVHSVTFQHGIITGEAPPFTYSPDGKLLAMTVSENDPKDGLYSTVRIVDPLKGPEIRTFAIEPRSYVSRVLFSPDSKLLAITTG